MKKIISIIVLVFVLAISLTSCDAILDMVSGVAGGTGSIAQKQQYEQALKHIEDEKYEEAYEILKGLEGYEPAEKELENFYFVPTSFAVVQNDIAAMEIEGDYDGSLLMQLSISQSSGYYSHTMKIECSYDSAGNWISGVATSDGESSTITNTYDKNNRLIETVEDGSTTTKYTYNSKGYLTKKVVTSDNSTTTTKYTYDSDGNLTKEVVNSGSSSHETTYTYDSDGNLVKIVSPKDITEYSYDSKGNLIKEVYSHGSYEHEEKTYSYDKNGNITKITCTEYGDTFTLKYTYDDDGHITKMEAVDEVGVLTFECDKYGNITKMNFPEEYGMTVTAEWKLVYYPNGMPEIVEMYLEIVNQIFDIYGDMFM